MSETNPETIDQAVDPPNNDGGTTNTTTKTASALDATSVERAKAVDPPNNDGGTTP